MASDDRMRISTRTVSPDDREFLAALYASTREEEVQQTGWPIETQQAFLRQQFEAQDTFYTQQLPKAESNIILVDGERAGRLYLDRRHDEIRVVDISLLPKFRGRGIGSGFLKDVQAEASAANLAVRIHVEHNNPAMRLYTRLGFVGIEDKGIYLLMEWRPERA